MKTTIKKYYLLKSMLVGALFFSTKIFAQVNDMPVFSLINNAAKLPSQAQGVILNKYFKAYNTASFPTEALSNFLQKNNNEPSVFKLAIAKNIVTLHLQPSNIVNNNYKLTIQNEQGLLTQTPFIENIFYKGYTDNNVKNIVRLTIKEGLVSGFIQTAGKEIFIQSLSDYVKDAPVNDVILYEAKNAIANDLPCGFTATEKMIETAKQQKQSTIENNTVTGECKKLTFVFLTDYSMFTYFNGDVALMQNKMLAVLNSAQGVYTGLNFNSNPIDDVGTDELQFEMAQFHITSCSKCDIIAEGQSPLLFDESIKVSNWINKYVNTNIVSVVYYWTVKPLIDLSTNSSYGGKTEAIIGTCSSSKIGYVICLYRENIGFLRDVSSHELGHVLGCVHDDIVNPTITSFIMYRAVNVNATTLSSIADFSGQIYNGYLYSSKAVVKRKIAELSSCLASCDSISSCEKIPGLSVSQNIITDSAVFTWQGNGNFYNVKVRENTINSSPILINQNITEKRFVVRGLAKCKYYTFEVSNNCGKKTSISFSISSFKANTATITHVRSSLHDVEIMLEASNAYVGYLKVSVDNIEKWNTTIAYPGKVILKDIFSDGARHRIDFYADINGYCKQTIFYKAPYYRYDATVFVNEGFNDCAKPINWKDSVWRKPANNVITYTPFWNFDSTTKDRVRTIQAGSIDSTCMVYFYDGGIPGRGTCLGGIDMTSPTINVKDYENIYLSFDYKYILRAYNIRQPFFKVQCYDGQYWQTIYDAPTTINNRTADSTYFWDTIPARKFIKLDAFENNNLQIRFVVEDSTFIIAGQIKTNSIYVALDNVRIDGYLKKESNKIVGINIFPNPVKDELFIKYDLQLQQPKYYRIFDAQGRTIQESGLNNYRINVANLSAAIYFIQFYFEDNKKSVTYKFYKF